MPVLPPPPLLNASDLRIEYPAPFRTSLGAAPAIPSPISGPHYGGRAGVGFSDTSNYFLGIDASFPITVGLRIVSIRLDGDYWKAMSSGSGNRGGTSLSVDGLVSIAGTTMGIGLAAASRFGGASGPSGSAIKLIYGTNLLLGFGVEADAILSSNGSMVAVMAGLHF